VRKYLAWRSLTSVRAVALESCISSHSIGNSPTTGTPSLGFLTEISKSSTPSKHLTASVRIRRRLAFVVYGHIYVIILVSFLAAELVPLTLRYNR
jgi:hypothetical protein